MCIIFDFYFKDKIFTKYGYHDDSSTLNEAFDNWSFVIHAYLFSNLNFLISFFFYFKAVYLQILIIIKTFLRLTSKHLILIFCLKKKL